MKLLGISRKPTNVSRSEAKTPKCSFMGIGEESKLLFAKYVAKGHHVTSGPRPTVGIFCRSDYLRMFEQL